LPPYTDSKPAEFDAYWAEMLRELSLVPPAPELERIHLRSTDFATMFGVRLTSVGPYRLFAYLSIPSVEPPFPAIFYSPNYGSVVDPIPQGATNALRSRFVTLTIAARGQRNADQPFAASYPGLLTEGIDDPSKYMFKGIVADTCRAVEYLLSRTEVDPGRVVCIGDDLALIAAALTGKISHVVCSPKLFYRTVDLAPSTDAYPLEEINDYLRLYPQKESDVYGTLSYFDPRWFAPSVEAGVLVAAESEGQPYRPLVGALGGDATLYETEHSNYKAGLFIQKWIDEAFGFTEAILPGPWR
jgi:cephalosporin-C deacetylase-like acetyl esterase